MRISFIIALSVLVLFSFCGTVSAFENDIGSSKLAPDSPFYFLKVIREDFEMKTALTNRVKLLRYLEFSTRRLREVKALANKDNNLISPTLEKYSYYLRNLPDKDLADEEVVTRIKDSLGIHLETLKEIYPQISDLRAKMAVLAALNKLVGRVDISASSKGPVCNLFAKEASSSALNQTEQYVLSQRALTCSGSRSYI